MKINKVNAEEKEPKENDEAWFDLEVIVDGENKEPDKHFAGKIKLNLTGDQPLFSMSGRDKA